MGNDAQGKNAVVDFWLYGVQAFGTDLDPPLGLTKAEMHPVYSSGTYAAVSGDIFYYQVADEFMGTVRIENAVPNHPYILSIEAADMPGQAADYANAGISYYDDSLNPPRWTTPGGIWHDASGVPGNTVEFIDFFVFETDAQGKYQGDFRSTTSPAGISYASGSMPAGEYTDVKFMVKDAEAWNVYSEYGSWCTQVLSSGVGLAGYDLHFFIDKNATVLVINNDDSTVRADYTRAEGYLYYQKVGSKLRGTLYLVGLKPGFSYQLKLNGKPSDPWANVQLGEKSGTWWCNTCNTKIYSDTYPVGHAGHNVEGFLVFEGFYANPDGTFSGTFELDTSYPHAPPEDNREASSVTLEPGEYDVMFFVGESQHPDSWRVVLRNDDFHFTIT